MRVEVLQGGVGWRGFWLPVLLVAGSILNPGAAHATCVSLVDGPPLSPGEALALTCQTSNGGAPANGSSQVNNLPAVPGSYTFANGYGAPTMPIDGSPAPGFGFYDDYVFTIGGAAANSITSTIDLADLQLSDLQVRLYSLAGNQLPTLGVPAGNLFVAWSNAISGPGFNGTVAVIPSTELLPGTYVLEVRGNITGTGGGSYAGTLNLTPVPLPAAAWLLLSGLGLVGLVARGRPV